MKIANDKIAAAKIRREEEKKQSDREMELSRLKGGKAQAAAKRAFEEQEQYLAIAQRKKDKEEAA